LRRDLNEKFPDCIFYFQPSEIITQIIDFGSITPIDVQVNGRHADKDREVAQNQQTQGTTARRNRRGWTPPRLASDSPKQT
jgi:hypothetical protein